MQEKQLQFTLASALRGNERCSFCDHTVWFADQKQYQEPAWIISLQLKGYRWPWSYSPKIIYMCNRCVETQIPMAMVDAVLKAEAWHGTRVPPRKFELEGFMKTITDRFYSILPERRKQLEFFFSQWGDKTPENKN